MITISLFWRTSDVFMRNELSRFYTLQVQLSCTLLQNKFLNISKKNKKMTTKFTLVLLVILLCVVIANFSPVPEASPEFPFTVLPKKYKKTAPTRRKIVHKSKLLHIYYIFIKSRRLIKR